MGKSVYMAKQIWFLLLPKFAISSQTWCIALLLRIS